MSAQSPVGARIPASRTVRRVIDVVVLCTTSMKLYLRVDEVHKLWQGYHRIACSSQDLNSASAVCEDPVLRAHVQAPLLQFLQRFSKPGIDGKSFTRGFGFRIASLAVYNSSPNEDREIFPVEVRPLQAHDFTGAKAETCRNQNHGVVWLGQLLQKEADLARC
jgi:hypothetical protein